jgi:16S rRNA (uracil1498-N3)-methyltransferase
MLFYLPNFENPVLPESEAFHCLKVLRKGKGDEIQVTNGLGQSAIGAIEIPDVKKCLLKIKEVRMNFKSWENEIWLAVAPTKQMERMEWMVEKSTEIGLDGFVFMHTARTERDVLKTDRLEKAAISAMKQSGQMYLPKIQWFSKWHDFPWTTFEHIWLADLSESAPSRLKTETGKNLIVIGPEGDFTPKELEEIKSHKARSIRLRPQVLRTETAAIFALSMSHLS